MEASERPWLCDPTSADARSVLSVELKRREYSCLPPHARRFRPHAADRRDSGAEATGSLRSVSSERRGHAGLRGSRQLHRAGYPEHQASSEFAPGRRAVDREPRRSGVGQLHDAGTLRLRLHRRAAELQRWRSRGRCSSAARERCAPRRCRPSRPKPPRSLPSACRRGESWSRGVVESSRNYGFLDSSTAGLRDGSIRAMWPRLGTGHCARPDAGSPERGRRRGRHRPSSPT